MKKDNIIFWIATGIIFLFEGMIPLSTVLFAPEHITAGTRPLGYPDYFALALITFKIFGAIALVIPALPSRVKEWVYAGFTFNLIFATISHGAVDGLSLVGFFPLIVLIILIVSYIYNFKINTDKSDSTVLGQD